jgi:F-type H+-transporting ATPase subunit gamma
VGAQLRLVRRRIRSVQSTAKITRAQELIASSRIIKAQQRVHDAQPYAREITWAVEAVVTRSPQIKHPLTTEPENPARAAVLILTSDRGFAGGYNASVLREAQNLEALLAERHVEAVPFVAGRKGLIWHRFRQRAMAGEWSGFSDTPKNANAQEITAALLEAYDQPAVKGAGEVGGGVDEIYMVHTEFVSMLSQRPVVNRILPLEIEETTEAPDRGMVPLYEFEPSPEDVLNALLPWYVQSRIFHALLDSAASEIAARRRAMKSATDNANELLDQLTLEANKARQAEITQEISEIVGGANALAETTHRE